METIDELKTHLANLTNIPVEQFSEILLTKLNDDSLFLHHLLVCKGDQMFTRQLLGEVNNHEENIVLPTDTTLLKNLSKSLINWAKIGFKRASLDLQQKRLSICQSCPHQSIPDNRSLYGIARTTKVCKLCGCDLNKKTSILSESCPDKSNGANGRWIN